MNELEKITIKYHKHLEEDAKEGMMYFTLEDVHKCMKEYHESKSDCISDVIILYCVMSEKDYWGNREILRMFTNRTDAETFLSEMNEDEYDDYVIEELKTGE